MCAFCSYNYKRLLVNEMGGNLLYVLLPTIFSLKLIMAPNVPLDILFFRIRLVLRNNRVTWVAFPCTQGSIIRCARRCRFQRRSSSKLISSSGTFLPCVHFDRSMVYKWPLGRGAQSFNFVMRSYPIKKPCRYHYLPITSKKKIGSKPKRKVKTNSTMTSKELHP